MSANLTGGRDPARFKPYPAYKDSGIEWLGEVPIHWTVAPLYSRYDVALGKMLYFVGLRENREYLYYLFSCGEPYKGLGKLGTQLNLNTDTIGDIYLPMTSPTEQQSIVRFLDRETAKIDALMAKVRNAIDGLKEFRTALISAAVTGKIDVRDETV